MDLIININNICLILDNELVTPNLVTILPSLGEYFEISLNIWVESFSASGVEHGWSELLRFTVTDNDHGSDGDRIPAIFINSAGFISVTFDNYFWKSIYIKLRTWIKFVMKQYTENGKVRYVTFGLVELFRCS